MPCSCRLLPVGHAWFRAVVHCYWGCATGCACLDSTFPHVSSGHHALGDNSTISLIFAWHGNLACQVTSPNVCMAALLRMALSEQEDEGVLV